MRTVLAMRRLAQTVQSSAVFGVFIRPNVDLIWFLEVSVSNAVVLAYFDGLPMTGERARQSE